MTERQQTAIVRAVYMLGLAGQRRQRDCELRVCKRHIEGHPVCADHYWNAATELEAAFHESAESHSLAG
jgi:hypothetical protein